MIMAIRKGQFPHVEVNPFEPYVDWCVVWIFRELTHSLSTFAASLTLRSCQQPTSSFWVSGCFCYWPGCSCYWPLQGVPQS